MKYMNRHEDELAVICCYVVMFFVEILLYPSNRIGISFGNFCQILKKCGNIKIGVVMIKKNRA